MKRASFRKKNEESGENKIKSRPWRELHSPASPLLALRHWSLRWRLLPPALHKAASNPTPCHPIKKITLTATTTVTIAINNIVQVTKTLASKQIPAITAALSTASSSLSLINLKVDGHSVQVPNDSTILDAINNSGSHVPTLCYHPEFEPKAVCEYIWYRISLFLAKTFFSYHMLISYVISYAHRSYVSSRCKGGKETTTRMPNKG